VRGSVVPGVTSQRPRRRRPLRMLRRPQIRFTSRQSPAPQRARMPRRPKIRMTSRQTAMSRHPSRSGHPIIGAGMSDPPSKVTSNIRTKLTETRTSTSASIASDLARTMYPIAKSTIYCCARAPAATDKRPLMACVGRSPAMVRDGVTIGPRPQPLRDCSATRMGLES
jgi:hypothetical protein